MCIRDSVGGETLQHLVSGYRMPCGDFARRARIRSCAHACGSDPVGSESSCPVFVAHHLSASGLSNLAGSEAVDETSCWGGVAHAAAGATLSAFLVSFFVRPERLTDKENP